MEYKCFTKDTTLKDIEDLEYINMKIILGYG